MEKFSISEARKELQPIGLDNLITYADVAYANRLLEDGHSYAVARQALVAYLGARSRAH